jgi:hypothetical protein
VMDVDWGGLSICHGVTRQQAGIALADHLSAGRDHKHHRHRRVTKLGPRAVLFHFYGEGFGACPHSGWKTPNTSASLTVALSCLGAGSRQRPPATPVVIDSARRFSCLSACLSWCAHPRTGGTCAVCMQTCISVYPSQKRAISRGALHARRQSVCQTSRGTRDRTRAAPAAPCSTRDRAPSHAPGDVRWVCLYGDLSVHAPGDVRPHAVGYSGGVRQELVRLSAEQGWDPKQFRIWPPGGGATARAAGEAGGDGVLEADLLSATFCLVAAGRGWSARLVQVRTRVRC